MQLALDDGNFRRGLISVESKVDIDAYYTPFIVVKEVDIML